MGQGGLLVTPQNSQPLPRAQVSLFALESFRRTERALRGEWGAELSQEKCAASREAPEVVELHLPGACEGAVAHKTFTDVSHGKNISVIFSLCFILYVWDMLLLKALLGSLFSMESEKKPRIPFCCPNSCQNWFNFSQGLQRLQEKHIQMHVEVSSCTVGLC